MRILLVADNLAPVRDLSSALKSAGGLVDQVLDSNTALKLALQCDFDIILVGLLFAPEEGYMMVRRMRSAQVKAPVIVLSRLSRPQDKRKAIAHGADDFVVMPVNSPELVARVQAVIRFSKGENQTTIQVGPLTLDFDRQVVTVNGNTVYLTSKEYSALELLMRRKGTAVTKEALFHHLYRDRYGPEIKVIGVLMCTLRKKLAKAGATRLIGTIWREGFMVDRPAHSDAQLPNFVADIPSDSSSLRERSADL